MNKTDSNFDTWFDVLQMQLSDAGINFKDAELVRKDYDDGKSLFEVLEEIKAEYAD